MPKRSASNAGMVHPHAVSKKARIDAPRATSSRPNKRPLPETFDDTGDPRVALPHTSNKARFDNSRSISETLAESPKPWPSIDDQPRRQQRATTIPLEWLQPIREAFDRSEAAFRQAREEYSVFRKNRLPSPAASEDEFATVYDSEAVEFGHVPLMFGLENDDPRVEEVFGTAYARRLQKRRRHLQAAASTRSPKIEAVPNIQLSSESSSSRPTTTSMEANRTLQDQQPMRPLRRSHRAQASHSIQRLLERNGTTGYKDSRISQPRPSKPLQREARAATPEQRHESLFLRLTRRSWQRDFYELDHNGKPRRVNLDNR